MSTMTRFLLALGLAVTVAVGTMMAGCGEKIAIPQPVGEYGTSLYQYNQTFEDPDMPFQLKPYRGFLYVVSQNSLVKRNQRYEEQFRVQTFNYATAVCVEPESGIVFVWDYGVQTVSWYESADLTFLGSSVLEDVDWVNSLATNPAGIEMVPGALTYLYLSDPVAGLVHRYAFDIYNGLSSYGILSRSDGESARFVHEPVGMSTDGEGALLVCDADTSRNWVIRFDSTPDTTDVTSDPDDEDPLRGLAIIFDETFCEPPATEDYVLGYAAACGQTDWVGRTGDAEGEFNSPVGIEVDNGGQILVADTRNNRIQMFDGTGEFILYFPTDGSLERPYSVAPVQIITATTVYPSALVYILLQNSSQVVLYEETAYKNDPSRGE